MSKNHALRLVSDSITPLRNLGPLPVVSPLGVFVAGRKHFLVIVRTRMDAEAVLDHLFSKYPLAEMGWDRLRAKARHTGCSGYWPVWTISRG